MLTYERKQSLRGFAERSFKQDRTAKIIVKAEEIIDLLDELDNLDEVPASWDEDDGSGMEW